jgi:hypothetical protein
MNMQRLRMLCSTSDERALQVQRALIGQLPYAGKCEEGSDLIGGSRLQGQLALLNEQKAMCARRWTERSATTTHKALRVGKGSAVFK